MTKCKYCCGTGRNPLSDNLNWLPCSSCSGTGQAISSNKSSEMKLATPDRKVSEQLRQIADELDKRLEDVAGQRMSFSLIVINAEPGSRMNYVANCNRDDVANALSSLLAGWGKGMPDIPAHEIGG